MMITDALNGHTIEDVRRNPDGSVTLYCDSGRTINLHVVSGIIQALPPKIALPERDLGPEPFSEQMRLREAFEGMMINYAHYNDHGHLIFVCEPLRHNRERYAKSYGHREVTLTHSNGLIDELPPVSAIVGLPGLSVFGKMP